MSEPSAYMSPLERGQRTVTQGTGHQTLMQVLYDEDIGVEAIAVVHLLRHLPCLIEPEWISKLPERDQAELMLLQYAEHYDPERSRLSCQLALGPEIDGMPLTIAPEE